MDDSQIGQMKAEKMATDKDPGLDREVKMVREHLEDIPCHTLPSGYKFRTYRNGDAAVWTALHVAAEPFFNIAPELFMQQFGEGIELLPSRMFFVETTEGQPVGSITAWWEIDRYSPGERGRIHWVVVHPEHQGQGIAKAMMTKALHAMRVSHDRAMLTTSAGRPIAVKIYLDFGFRPDPGELENTEYAGLWEQVLAKLEYPTWQELDQTRQGQNEAGS